MDSSSFGKERFISCLEFSLPCRLIVGAGNIATHISYDVVICCDHNLPLVHLLLYTTLDSSSHLGGLYPMMDQNWNKVIILQLHVSIGEKAIYWHALWKKQKQNFIRIFLHVSM